MPVTAKLSRKFYETFGDEIATSSSTGSIRWTPPMGRVPRAVPDPLRPVRRQAPAADRWAGCEAGAADGGGEGRASGGGGDRAARSQLLPCTTHRNTGSGTATVSR